MNADQRLKERLKCAEIENRQDRCVSRTLRGKFLGQCVLSLNYMAVIDLLYLCASDVFHNYFLNTFKAVDKAEVTNLRSLTFLTLQ